MWMKSNKVNHRNRNQFIRIWIRELSEPEFKTTKSYYIQERQDWELCSSMNRVENIIIGVTKLLVWVWKTRCIWREKL